MTNHLQPQIFPTSDDMSNAAAEAAAAWIRESLSDRGRCSLIVATGASQMGLLAKLAAASDIDWSRVDAFHLDEYVGLPLTHPASFRRYLWERFVRKLPVPIGSFHWLDGERDAAAEAARVGATLREHPVDVALVGIGENAHLAFNDPPADFETEEPYLVVELDEACRRQQLGEGWFPTLGDVPMRAISMSVRQILKSRRIVCTVPDERKAEAVRAAVEGPVTPQVPASILQEHPNVSLFVDAAAASLLKGRA